MARTAPSRSALPSAPYEPGSPWPRLDGQVSLITGATGSMGQVVATDLAWRGAVVVLVARDLDKGEAARRELIAATGNDAIDLLIADLTDFAAVRRLAATFQERYPALHILVNNAGGAIPEYRHNAEGVELNLAINYFSPFLLTNLLLPILVASAPARVVNVASDAMAKSFDLQALRDAPRFLPVRAYAPAKLALVMSGYALARRLEGTGVTVNAVHPGLTATRIWESFTPRPLRPLQRAALAAAVKTGIFLTPEQGAATTIYAATAPELAGVTGTYFAQEREHRSPPDSYDTVLQEQLWEFSYRLVGLFPDVPQRRAIERGVAGDAAPFAGIRTPVPLTLDASSPAGPAATATTATVTAQS